MSITSMAGNIFSAIGKSTNKAADKAAKGISKNVQALTIKGPNINHEFKNTDVNFIKNDYRPEKIDRKEIFKRILKSSNIADEIEMSNEDIMLALFNIKESQKIDSKFPKIKSTYFKEMVTQFLKQNKTTDVTSKNLKNLSLTQEKIYKILFKIEDELIDNQDTSIKEKSNDEFLDRLENLLKTYNVSTKEEPGNQIETGGPSILDMFNIKNIASTLWKPFAYLFNKTKNILSSVTKAMGKGFASVGKWIGKAFPNLSKFASSLWNGAKGIYSKIGAKITSVTGLASKALNSAKAGISKVFKFVGNHVFSLIELGRIFYLIAMFYKSAEKSIDEPGIIEKLIFSVISGITEWVKDYIDLIGMLSDFLIWIVDFAKKSSKLIFEHFKTIDSTYVPFIEKAINLMLDYFPISAVNEYIIKPTVEFLQKNGSYGADCGVIAVQVYREFKHAFTNAIPNKSTFNMLFGNDEDLESIQKKGLYNWNKVGESQINGSAKDLANLATVSELKKILEHDDLSEFDASKVKEALKIKAEEKISDEQVKLNSQSNKRLLEIKNNFNYDLYEANSKLKNLDIILKLIDNSLSLVNSDPTKCMLEYHTDEDGKDLTSTPNHILWNGDVGLFGLNHSVDIPKVLITDIIKSLEKLKINFTLNRKTDNMFYTPFGTFFTVSYEHDLMKSDDLFKIAKKATKNSRGQLGVYYKIIGSYDGNGIFREGTIGKDDLCVASYCTQNIITTSDIAEPNKKAIPTNVKPEVKQTEVTTTPTAKPQQYAQHYSQPNYGSSAVLTQPTKIPKITKNEAMTKTWKYLKSLKFTNEQIAGIMGNLKAESGFGNSMYKVHFDRSASGRNDGPSGGICQWHDTLSELGRGRLSNLLKFAGWTTEQISAYYNQIKSHNWSGDLPVPLETQLAYLKHELDTKYKKALNGISASQSVADAARIWVYDYEKPADKEKEVKTRTGYGLGILKEFSDSETTDVSPTFEAPDVPLTDEIKSGGYNLIQPSTSYMPQKGDICVVESSSSNKVSVFDGENWVSNGKKTTMPFKGPLNNAKYYRAANTEVSTKVNTSTYVPPQTQAEKVINENKVVQNIKAESQPSEFEGEAENLFSINYNSILV